eukprot:TRINITY_DN72643_c0_g1_i1.p1 TRINITY_DN72643_c0_g1~~TRINITY_DN72643_c0_g1_i1.p1  ORF type:complete len:314 (-),score=76.63 TRINITY_DN72643_c0_g1_i1:32-973(-)
MARRASGKAVIDDNVLAAMEDEGTIGLVLLTPVTRGRKHELRASEQAAVPGNEPAVSSSRSEPPDPSFRRCSASSTQTAAAEGASFVLPPIDSARSPRRRVTVQVMPRTELNSASSPSRQSSKAASSRTFSKDTTSSKTSRRSTSASSSFDHSFSSKAASSRNGSKENPEKKTAFVGHQDGSFEAKELADLSTSDLAKHYRSKAHGAQQRPTAPELPPEQQTEQSAWSAAEEEEPHILPRDPPEQPVPETVILETTGTTAIVPEKRLEEPQIQRVPRPGMNWRKMTWQQCKSIEDTDAVADSSFNPPAEPFLE